MMTVITYVHTEALCCASESCGRLDHVTARQDALEGTLALDALSHALSQRIDVSPRQYTVNKHRLFQTARFSPRRR